MKQIITFIFAGIFIFIVNIYPSTFKDTVSTDWEDESDSDLWIDNIDNFSVHFRLRSKPTLTFDYGFNNITNKSLSREINKLGNIGLKIGFTNFTGSSRPYIVKYKESYLLLSNYSKDLYKKEVNNKLDMNIWQFGIGWSKGMGYDLSGLQIIPYKSSEMIWTRIKTDLSKLDTSNSVDLADKNTLELFDETFRFGTTTTIGTLFHFYKTVGIDVNYKRMIVFPRHMFWAHIGSVIIESIGENSIDWFVSEVFHSSPAAAPVINILLKAAYSYGIYELRKDRMNWPFDTAKPMFFDQFNISLKFTL